MRLFRNNLLFEFIAAMAVIGVVAGLLLTRLSYYQERAEKANMEFTISAFESALRVQKSLMLIQGREREYAVLVQQNPVDWMEQKPANYLGKFDLSPSQASLAGHWYFDTTKRILVYTPRHRDHFRGDGPASHSVQLHAAIPASTSGEASIEPTVLNVRLQLTHQYQWF